MWTSFHVVCAVCLIKVDLVVNEQTAMSERQNEVIITGCATTDEKEHLIALCYKTENNPYIKNQLRPKIIINLYHS